MSSFNTNTNSGQNSFDWSLIIYNLDNEVVKGQYDEIFELSN
jgi:hypothetical protein